MNARIRNPLLALWDALKFYVVGLYTRLGTHHAFLMSGGLAFSLFVCIIPLTLIVFSVLGNFVERPTVVAEIQSLVDRIVPYPEYAESLKKFIAGRLKPLADLKEVAGVIGIVGLILASSGLFSSVRTILNTVFRREQTESVVVGKLWDLALVTIVLVFFLIFIIALPAIEAITQTAENASWLSDLGLGFAQQGLFGLISLAMIFVAFYAVYLLVPVRHPPKRVTIIAAISAAILWTLAKELFGYYVGHVVTLKHVYGVYAFLVVVAFWIYYSALVFIVGAEIGQLNHERRRG